MTENCEMLCVQTPGVLFAVCYRPPDGLLEPFLIFLERMLEVASENKYKVVLGRDFNIDMSSDGARKTTFQMIFVSSGFINAVETFTRITNYEN